MSKWWRIYVGFWIAIAPSMGLLWLFAYTAATLQLPLWARIIWMVVCVHVIFGWLWFVATRLDKLKEENHENTAAK